MSVSPLVLAIMAARSDNLSSGNTGRLLALTAALGSGGGSKGLLLALVLAQSLAPTAAVPSPVPPPLTPGKTGSPPVRALPPAHLLEGPEQVTVKARAGSHGFAVKLYWSVVANAVGYKVTRRHKDGFHVLCTTTNTETFDELPKEAKLETYTYEVAAMNRDGHAGNPACATVS